MINRIKNPLFIMALSGLIYNALKYFGINIPDDEFRTFVDIVSYLLLGAGVYTSYEK